MKLYTSTGTRRIGGGRVTPRRASEIVAALHDGKVVRIGDIIIRESPNSYTLIEEVRYGWGTPPNLPVTLETFLFAMDKDTEILRWCP